MKQELLECLKSNDRDWLRYYADNIQSDRSRELKRLTEVRLKQILLLENSPRPVVFIVETNPIEFVAAFLAGVIAEANLFLCDPSWQKQEWEQVLQLVKPDLVYGDRQTRESIAKVRTAIENPISTSELFEESLIMIPTGGTSGKIRFAMHTWETLSASVSGFKAYFGCQRINSYCTLPLYHVSGLMQLIRSLLTQGNLTICQYKVLKIGQPPLSQSDYFISLVPTQLQYLIEFVPEWLTKFKTVLLGGAPPMRSLLDIAREYNIPVALTYGMTETASGVTILKPQDFLAGNNSNGLILPHAKIELASISAQSNLQSAESKNNIGRIKISSGSLCLGYYPQRFTSGQALVTDDLGYLDRQGYLHLVGRNSQKIITGGENVFPAEVESAIYATGLVKDVCVIGMSDRLWGQVVTAIYVPTELKPDLNSIEQKLREQLARYKQPKNWIEVDAIPRNDRGKINYQKLLEIVNVIGKK